MSNNCEWQKVIRTVLLRLQILLIVKEIIHLERLFYNFISAHLHESLLPNLFCLKKPFKLSLLQNLDYLSLPPSLL